MRILEIAPPWFPVPPVRYGGIELVVAGLTDGLVAAGHDVTLAAAGGSSTRARLIHHHDTAPSASLGDPIVELPHLLAAYGHRHEFDVIHDHTTVGVGVGALLDGPPRVHTVHGPWTPGVADLLTTVAGRVNVVAISQDQASRRPAGLELAGVLHNGIDTTRFPFDERGDGHLAWIGRASPDKGADVAIEVARRLGRPLRMAVKVNEPDEHVWWHEVIAGLPPGADVDVVLNATHAEKLEVLRGADAMLFPISWEEPFGLVMIEANACGVPVVAWSRGAAPEVLEDGRTGVLVEPGDIDGLCLGVRSAVEHIDRRACRQRVEERFSVERMVAGHVELYQRLTAAAGRDDLGDQRTPDVGGVIDLARDTAPT